MAYPSIPGLNYGPIDEIPPSDVSGIELMAFNCEPYTVPAPHVFGKCRLITEFEKLQFVGEGAYGQVYRVRDKKLGKIVALKKLKLPKETISFPLNYIREINILKTLKHENIVNIIDVAVGRVFESTYLVLEYCPYQLSKVIDDEHTRALLNHSYIKCIMHQLFFGLSYLHENSILHRDLTVSNILFTDLGFLKIADFGNCRMAIDGKMTPNVVTRWYRAPEILFGATTYTSAVDMWSAGCIFAELILKRPLFKGDSDNSMISLMIDLLGAPTEQQWPGCLELPVLKNFELRYQPVSRLTLKFAEQPATCITLLHRIMKYNPNARFTAEKCLINSYFTDKPSACDFDSLVALLRKADEI